MATPFFPFFILLYKCYSSLSRYPENFISKRRRPWSSHLPLCIFTALEGSFKLCFSVTLLYPTLGSPGCGVGNSTLQLPCQSGCFQNWSCTDCWQLHCAQATNSGDSNNVIHNQVELFLLVSCFQYHQCAEIVSGREQLLLYTWCIASI